MMKRGKKILFSMAFIMLFGITTVHADTGNFEFDMYKRQGPYISDSVRKADNEQKAYVTPTGGNVASGDVFGFRVRTADGLEATEYKTWTSYTKNTLSYSVRTGVPNYNYRLYGQVDSTGAYDNVWVYGRWTP